MTIREQNLIQKQRELLARCRAELWESNEKILEQRQIIDSLRRQNLLFQRIINSVIPAPKPPESS